MLVISVRTKNVMKKLILKSTPKEHVKEHIKFFNYRCGIFLKGFIFSDIIDLIKFIYFYIIWYNFVHPLHRNHKTILHFYFYNNPCFCLQFFLDLTDAFESHLRGPSFVMEPPARLEFSNSSGGWLDCSASGSPQPTIDWLSSDGTSIGDVNSIRRVLRNGTLVLLPFPAAAYRQDIHNTVYRCVASNTVGRVISRDVQVKAGKFKILTKFARFVHSIYF